MEELWNAKGYGGLRFSRQNLRDQAARLGKQQRITNDNANQTLKSRSEVNSRQFEESEILDLLTAKKIMVIQARRRICICPTPHKSQWTQHNQSQF